MTDTKHGLLKSRIQTVRTSSEEGSCVLYVMSRDQRVRDNHALLAAQKHAIAKGVPLAVVFCLYNKTGFRRREHFQFMLDGLAQVEKDLHELNIPFMMVIGDGKDCVSAVIHDAEPDAVYFDFSPLRGPRKLIEHVREKVDAGPLQNRTSLYIVDTHNMIPVWEVSSKKEIGARTIRSKVHKRFAEYLLEPGELQPHPHDWPAAVQSLTDLQDRINEVLESIPAAGIQVQARSGEKEAHARLTSFIDDELDSYAEDRNDPTNDALSGLSPYLHFGQLSSLRVVLDMQDAASKAGAELHLLNSGKMPKKEDDKNPVMAGINALLEEMIVRKELSDNYCYYEEHYDDVRGADSWAKQTIEAHDSDEREHLYSYEELESAETHDPAWNAAQLQMTRTGKMHGYMRMYWAKKIKEWTPDAETALKFAIKLNDTYSIDGGDPNGYVGVMWSICGVHDRPWTERDVFGKVRYMNYEGLKRKFDVEAYQQQWSARD